VDRLTKDFTNEPVLGTTDEGQPQGQAYVRNWAEGLDIPIGGETIMFVDCEAAFYRTSNTRATAQVLQKAGVEFGLMNEQWCCGGPAAEMGYVEQSRAFAEHNVQDWRASGVKRIIAIEPHDYIHFTEDYPAYFGADFDFEVVQILELVANSSRTAAVLIIRSTRPSATTIPPLNKRKNIHEAPRFILNSSLADFMTPTTPSWSYVGRWGRAADREGHHRLNRLHRLARARNAADML
jgi:heterodisulfide reductase subunit D